MVERIYDTLKGILYNDLPKNAKDYIKRIEDLAKVPITWIGTGPERESII